MSNCGLPELGTKSRSTGWDGRDNFYLQQSEHKKTGSYDAYRSLTSNSAYSQTPHIF